MRCPPRVLLRFAPLVLTFATASAYATPRVYGESMMVKVRPSTPPRADAGVELVAVRNELISFQIVVHGGDTGAKRVRAELPGLRGPGVISGLNVTLYREALLDITTPTFPFSETGPWPDALVPDVDEVAGEKRNAFPFDVPPGEARAIWVDVLVPMGARPGLYEGAVRVGGEGFSASVPVALEVVGLTLPSTPSLATAFILYAPHVCQSHLGPSNCGGVREGARLIARYQRMALEHRITVSNPFLFMPTSDWRLFDSLYGPFLDGTAYSRLSGARMTTAQYTGARDVASYAAFAAHFKEKGWLDRAYDYTFDEPSTQEHFEEIARRVGIVRQGAPELRTLVTATLHDAQKHDLTPAIDVLVPIVNWMDGTANPYLGDQRSTYDAFLQEDPRRRLWLYQCCMGHGCGAPMPENAPGSGWPSYMVDTSAAKNRAMQWIDFRERVTGELYYEMAMALPTAWEDQYRFAGNGDGTLFYPGTPARIGGETHVPVASIRLKLIRAGIQDYELLKMVSDAGDPVFARELVNSVIPASHRVTDDGAAFERARLRLISRLAELQPKPKPDQGGPSQTPEEETLPSAEGHGDDAVSPEAAVGCATTRSANGLAPLCLLLLVVAWGQRSIGALTRGLARVYARARPERRRRQRRG